MKKLITNLLVFATVTLSANSDISNINLNLEEKQYSVRGIYGVATENRLENIMIGNLGSFPEHLAVYGIDGGYLLKKDIFDCPIDVYVKGGLSYFDEGQHDDVYEVLTFIKLYYNFDLFNKGVRFGFGEGVSYTSNYLESEKYNNIVSGGGQSKFLNYLDITLDFDIGKIFNSKDWEDVYFGILLKHRSGIFGTINNVRDGGSNYNSFYIEKKF